METIDLTAMSLNELKIFVYDQSKLISMINQNIAAAENQINIKSQQPLPNVESN